MVKNGLPITTRNLVFEMVWQAGRTHASLPAGSLTEKDKSMEMFENSSLHTLRSRCCLLVCWIMC